MTTKEILKQDSYLVDCYIYIDHENNLSNKPLFTEKDGVVTARLYKYAIIPIDKLHEVDIKSIQNQ